MSALLPFVIRAPLWVWPLLALLVGIGLRDLKPRTIPKWPLFIIPAVSVALSVARLAAAPHRAAALAVYVAAAAVFAAPGVLVGRRVDAKPAGGGRIEMPGSSFTLVVGLSIFAISYTFGIAFGLRPSLRTDVIWGLLPVAVGGALTGFVCARQAAILRSSIAAPPRSEKS
jgi:hypothetical protein